jgi:hypothetical protein
MQSSVAVVLRALLMLACLVAIPLAALSGTSLPKLVNTVLDGRWLGCLSSAGGAILSEAPQFEPTVSSVMPAAQAAQVAPDWRANLLTRGPKWPPELHEPSPPTVRAAVYEAPLGPAAGVTSSHPSAPNPAASDAAAGPNASAWMMPAQQPHEMLPAAQGTHQRGAVVPAGEPATQAAGALDQFTFIQDRLRKLGATYYLLESWGSRQDLYRFYCKMAIGGNPNYTRHFEATHSEPLRAMALVLKQVEAWRTGPE